MDIRNTIINNVLLAKPGILASSNGMDGLVGVTAKQLN